MTPGNGEEKKRRSIMEQQAVKSVWFTTTSPEESKFLAKAIINVVSPYLDEQLNENDEILLTYGIEIMRAGLPVNQRTALQLIKILCFARKQKGEKPTDTALDELILNYCNEANVSAEEYLKVKKEEKVITDNANRCIDAIVYYSEVYKRMASERRRLITYKIDTREHAEKLILLLPPNTIKKMDMNDDSSIKMIVSVPAGNVSSLITSVIKNNGGVAVEK